MKNWFLNLFLVLTVIKMSKSIDLKCKYQATGTHGACCTFDEIMPLLAELQDTKFKIIGVTEAQKKKVKEVFFLTAFDLVSAVEEAMKTFPNIEVISISDIKLKVLTFKYLDDLLKAANNKIKALNFKNCNIDFIDPQAVILLMNMKKLDLLNNLCVSKMFKKSSDLAQLIPYLSQCTTNFKSLKSFCKFHRIPDCKIVGMYPPLNYFKKLVTISKPNQDNITYYLSTDPALNWFDAGGICNHFGLEFAIIETLEDQNKIDAAFTDDLKSISTNVWVGGTNVNGHNKTFYWAKTGNPIAADLKFDTGEPNNLSNEKCLHLKTIPAKPVVFANDGCPASNGVALCQE